MAKEQSKKKKSEPIKRFRMGALSVSAWENESKQGNKFLNFTIQKRYFDGKDWQTTDSMNVSDLSNLRLLMEKAVDFSLGWDSKEREESDDDNDDEEDDD